MGWGIRVNRVDAGAAGRVTAVQGAWIVVVAVLFFVKTLSCREITSSNGAHVFGHTVAVGRTLTIGNWQVYTSLAWDTRAFMAFGSLVTYPVQMLTIAFVGVVWIRNTAVDGTLVAVITHCVSRTRFVVTAPQYGSVDTTNSGIA